MASLSKVTMSFCIVVAVILCNVDNIKADTETGDDLFFEDLQAESRLSFTTGTNGSSLIPS